MAKQIQEHQGAPGGSPSPKRTHTKREDREVIPPLKGLNRAVPVILFALAIFIGLCFFMNNTGSFGRWIRQTLYGLFSFGAFIIPFLLILHAIFYASDTHKKRRISRMLFSLLTLIFFCSTVYTIEFFGKEMEFLPKEYFARGQQLKGGGYIGSVVAYAITKVFGSVGLIIIALMILALYITFFFAKEGNTLVRFGLKLLTAILTFLSKIEKGFKYAFDPEERAKRRKAKQSVQKQRELMEDEFFDVDDGLERLEIPALGIAQVRDSRSQEQNPMLHERVIHEEGECTQGAQSSPLEEVVNADTYEAFVIEDIRDAYETPHTVTHEPPTSAQAGNPYAQSATYTQSGAQAQGSPYGQSSAQATSYTQASSQAQGTSYAQTSAYGGPSREMNAEEAFGADFDAFDVQRNQEMMERNARVQASATAPLQQTIDSVTPEEVEQMRRRAEFERRKASILASQEMAQDSTTSSAQTGAYSTPQSTSGAQTGAYSAPQSTSGAQTGAYSAPQSTSGAQTGTYSAPQSTSGAQAGVFSTPQSTSSAQTGTYSAPQSTSGAQTRTPSVEESQREEFITPESYAHIAQIVGEEGVSPATSPSQRSKVSTFTFGEQTTRRPLDADTGSFTLTIDKTPKATPVESEPVAPQRPAPTYRESESTVFVRGDKGREEASATTVTSDDPFARIAERIARGEGEPVQETSATRTTETTQAQAVASATAQTTTTPATREEAGLIGAVLREFETEQGPFSEGIHIPSEWTTSGFYEQNERSHIEVTREIIEEPVYPEEEENPLEFMDEESEEYGEEITESPEEEVTDAYIPPEAQNPTVLEQRELFSFLRGTDPNAETTGTENVPVEQATERPSQTTPHQSEMEEVVETEEEDAPPFDGAVRGGSSRFAEYVSSMSRPEERPKPKEESKPRVAPDYSAYQFPPIDLLKAPPPSDDADAQMEINDTADKLIDTLESFRVQATIKGYDRGPRITRYEVVPARGVKVSAITNLFDNISLALAADGVRMEAPIPGKSAIGFEIPNKKPSNVYLRDLIESDEFMTAESKTLVCMGKDVAGLPVYGDIAKMPHVLVAGATGMGKSVCINAMMLSILFRARPDEVKLIMIDPKKVEFQPYNGIPHLLVPVVIDPKQAAGALMWAVDEMEKRFDLIEQLRVKKIDDYNKKVKEDPSLGTPMPKIIIVIDELNDLMIQVRDPVENLIMRIAQKARAAGIHLIIGTQRPSVNVITGVIKANIPSRISCKVASSVDSRTILETAGAEKLLDRGDMLFFPVTRQKPLRVQGAYVSDTEVDNILDFLREQAHGEAGYDEEVLDQINRAASKCSKSKGGSDVDDDDDDEGSGEGYLNDRTFLDAVKVALHAGKISTSLLQRKLSIGFGRAAKYIDIMEDLGVVGEKNGQKPRDVLISMSEWEELLSRRSLD